SYSSHIFTPPPATTEIYTLSLHDALPIYQRRARRGKESRRQHRSELFGVVALMQPNAMPAEVGRTIVSGSRPRRPTAAALPDLSDRKSTRLNSSHLGISYAVFCLKKKKKN